VCRTYEVVALVAGDFGVYERDSNPLWVVVSSYFYHELGVLGSMS